MVCYECGAENPAGLKFCEECATPFKKRCARCGFENSAAARFCGDCAQPIGGATAMLTTQPGATPPFRATKPGKVANLIRSIRPKPICNRCIQQRLRLKRPQPVQ